MIKENLLSALANEAQIISDETDPTTGLGNIYMGFIDRKTIGGSPELFLIKRINITAPSAGVKLYMIEYAGGTAAFDKEWDNRSVYAYSYIR